MQSNAQQVLAWLPSEIVQSLDLAEFAVLPESARKVIDAHADALGVHLVAYRKRDRVRGGDALCKRVEPADPGRDFFRRIASLEEAFDVVLVAYARPMRLRPH